VDLKLTMCYLFHILRVTNRYLQLITVACLSGLRCLKEFKRVSLSECYTSLVTMFRDEFRLCVFMVCFSNGAYRVFLA